uniref:Uncharacterized protein n=1 Tax=Micrurus surinamensis TaxID=129470 RepID=A0A2D4P1Q7_MICSU
MFQKRYQPMTDNRTSLQKKQRIPAAPEIVLKSTICVLLSLQPRGSLNHVRFSQAGTQLISSSYTEEEIEVLIPRSRILVLGTARDRKLWKLGALCCKSTLRRETWLKPHGARCEACWLHGCKHAILTCL